MNFFKFFLVTVTSALFFSCSSGDDNSSSNEFFNLNYEGTTINVTQFQAQRSERSLAVTAVSNDGLGISFEFNEEGNIGHVNIYPTTASANYDAYSSYRHYASNYFNFELIELDSQNKTVEVEFSGNLYEDEYFLSGTTKHIEGSFKIKYEDVIPSVSGLGLSANIAGQNFLDASSDSTGGFFGGSDIGLTYYNASPYTITLNMNHDNTTTGNYSFNASSVVNNVKLSKYDATNDTYTDYNTVGTFNVTEKIVGFQVTVVTGTYSFNATNPNDNSQLNVTNGIFKVAYINY